MKGIFELRDHRDLFKKLERDQAAFAKNPRDSDTAFNFFVTAWHMLEWVYPGNANRQKRKQITESSNLLRICEHVAVGAKHFALENTKLESIDRTYRDKTLAALLAVKGYIHAARHADRLMIDLDPSAAEEFGRRSIPAAGLSAMVVDYWREHLNSLDSTANNDA